MKKNYTSAPLPFQGQKRRFINAFGVAMTELKTKQKVDIIVDLFGGSGLLSHTAKRIFPEAKVVYNDFDNYSLRLQNISKTNELLADLRVLVSDLSDGIKVDETIRNSMLGIIRREDKAGYVDYITLSSSLLFSAKYVTNLRELEKESFYNNIKASDYDVNALDYLDGIDVVHSDYKELYQLYKDIPNVLFLVDPPYLSTDTKTYHSDKYWKLRDYLDVLNVLVGSNYFFFTSNKSSLIELCEWFADNRNFENPFKNSVLNTQNITLNKTAGYKDMMLYKFVE